MRATSDHHLVDVLVEAVLVDGTVEGIFYEGHVNRFLQNTNAENSHAFFACIVRLERRAGDLHTSRVNHCSSRHIWTRVVVETNEAPIC